MTSLNRKKMQPFKKRLVCRECIVVIQLLVHSVPYEVMRQFITIKLQYFGGFTPSLMINYEPSHLNLYSKLATHRLL